ncbi:oryzin precursor [Ampelomyces quisqualis]|uniref:Oryzin n=1 Tax=Ampelomyces quisqualis TaxID=50730 RepID=A0A6A5Q9R9_AMPQU|nr:oryzin precursor [Ampelomyces quisqualis]
MQFFTCINALAAAAVLLLANVAPVASRTTDNAIAGEYIIQLKPDTTASIDAHYDKVRSIHARNLDCRNSCNFSAGIQHKYQFNNFQAYAGSFDYATIKEIEALPEVLFVEPNYRVEINSIVNQSPTRWNLALLSYSTWVRNWPVFRKSYVYDSSAGAGTFSYVLDTGIRLSHSEFGGRAIFGYNAVTYSTTDDDETGHGTHVAGIIGGTTYGVAKSTTLVAVKVLGTGLGSIGDLLNGFEWAVRDIRIRNRNLTAVINISVAPLGRSVVLENAVDAAEGPERSVLVVTCAVNRHRDAARESLCRSPGSICVGAVDQKLQVSRDSNFGPTVDIYAPGTDIMSADSKSDTSTKILSGTSAASAHVAGLVSYLRGLEGPSSAANIKARVYALARKHVILGTRGGNNLLAYNGAL